MTFWTKTNIKHCWYRSVARIDSCLHESTMHHPDLWLMLRFYEGFVFSNGRMQKTTLCLTVSLLPFCKSVWPVVWTSQCISVTHYFFGGFPFNMAVYHHRKMAMLKHIQPLFRYFDGILKNNEKFTNVHYMLILNVARRLSTSVRYNSLWIKIQGRHKENQIA